MSWVALNCPQCGAPLPRMAIWRSVTCGSCGALITRSEAVVTRDSFRRAWQRARAEFGSGNTMECGGERYLLMQSLGDGEISQVYLAQRIGMQPFLATVKLSSAPSAAGRYAREAQVLRKLREADGAADFFLPQAVAQGAVEGVKGQHALVLRHPNGFWGSLAALSERFPKGIDPRHAVWIWRRMLTVLGLIHRQGWRHGDVRPEHALVHPADHGVLVIGWAAAKEGAGPTEQAMDLMRSARVIQVLLCGVNEGGGAPHGVPEDLAGLVKQAANDEAFCRSQRAEGLDAALKSVAQAAFGPPRFLTLTI